MGVKIYMEDFLDIKTSTIKSVKWAVLVEVVSRLIQPLFILLLTRILSAEVFGIMGVVMIVIGFVQIFQDFGLGSALVQRDMDVEESANIIFWTNIVFSIFIFFVFFVSAPFIGRFFREPTVIPIFRVLCLQILFYGFILVPQALFQREFQFQYLFYIKLFSSLVFGITVLFLALLNYGIWSLVFGTIISSLVQVLFLWKFNQWRPRLTYDFRIAKQLFGFSVWVMLELLATWFFMWGDSLVIGHFIGIKELGIYRIGNTFLMLIFGLFFSHLLPVAYPMFSRLQSRPEKFKQWFININKIIGFISLPLGISLAILARPISSIVFGTGWQGIEMVIAFIGMAHAISWLSGINSEAYRAIGRPDINSKLLLFIICYYFPIYILAAHYGFNVFCIARFIIVFISLGLHIFVVNKILKLPFTYLIQCVKSPLIGIIVLAITVGLFLNLIGTFVGVWGLFKIAGIGLIGIICYVSVLWLLEKNTVLQFLSLLRKCIE